MAHELVYRLEDQLLVYRVDILQPPRDHYRKTRVSDGSIAEEYFQITSKLALVPQTVVDFLRALPVEFNSVTVSVTGGALNCYYAPWSGPDKRLYLGPTDPRLLEACSCVVAKYSPKNEGPLTAYYYLTRADEGPEWGLVADYFRAAEKMQAYAALCGLMAAHEASNLILSPKRDGHWAYISVPQEQPQA